MAIVSPISPSTRRVLNANLECKIMSAAEAAALIRSGNQVGKQLHWFGLSQVRSDGARPPHRRSQIPRPEISGQRLHWSFHRP
jgi:hypothetical protein